MFFMREMFAMLALMLDLHGTMVAIKSGGGGHENTTVG